MALFKDSKFAEYGIVTRASKGAELTHDEMDNNVVTALDVMMFGDVAWKGTDEYPAIFNAGVAPTAGNTVTLNPINGYCAIKLQGSANVGNSAQFDNNLQGWIYRAYFSSTSDSVSNGTVQEIVIQDGDEYLVISSSVPVDVSFAGSATAGIVQDIPPIPFGGGLPPVGGGQ